MEVLMIIGGIVLSYIVFVLITCWIARMMFPKIEISDDDLLDFEGLKKLKNQIVHKHPARSKFNEGSWLKPHTKLKSNPQLW